MKRLLALVVIGSLLLLAGCGRKTPAIPPQAVIAGAITDLRSQLDDRAVTLTWTYPRLSVKGARIDNIRTFVVYKAQIPAADYCSGCQVVYDHEFEVNARLLEPGGQVAFRDTGLEAGNFYVYMVRANSGWRILSKDSNRIAFSRQQPLLAPPDVQVDSGDNTLILSWSPVKTRADGSPVTDLQYQVYRSQDNTNFRPLGLPAPGLSYIDPSVSNGRTYFYQIRAVLGTGDIMTLGSASKTAIGIPVDMTPPEPPPNLNSVVRPEGLQLHWRASAAADIAGYYIYRRKMAEAWQRIATTNAGAITYTDLTELPPGDYSYQITAFDKGARRNESAPSPTVSYTKP
jgi:predicted small lipoprotein YifL